MKPKGDPVERDTPKGFGSIRSVRTILDERVIKEINSLLWFDAKMYKGNWDMGWACRDHAIVVSGLLHRYGYDPAIAEGKCMFVQGAAGDLPPVGIGQPDTDRSSHTWVNIENLGAVDISPRLGERLGRWRPLNSPGVLEDHWICDSKSRIVRTNSLAEYRDAINRASHLTDNQVAVYWQRDAVVFTESMLDTGLTFANSPRSLRLRDRFDDSLYRLFVNHLCGVLEDQRATVGHLSNSKAWAVIAEL